MKNQKFEYPYQDPANSLEVRVNDLISRLSLDEKIGLTATHQLEVNRLGIKEYFIGGEAAHGVARVGGKATVFPQPIGLASTWNKDLMYKIGSVIGDEARAYYKKNNEKGGLTLWAPTVDMEKDPRWGRTEEAYGEDPCLTGEMSSQLVLGMQGDHPFYLKMSAALKHFLANNNEKDRCSCSSSVDPRNMREYYLKAFESGVVKGKVTSMMTAYNSINGTPAIVNPIVKKVVKDEWGLDGFIVCDGMDFSQNVTHHGYDKEFSQTACGALKSGIDCMTDRDDIVHNGMRDALAKNLITEEDIDNALRNIFKIRFRLGQFDSEELNPYSSITEKDICKNEHSELAYKAARESIVLLKNENNILPLKKDKVKKVAVIGPLANELFTDYYSGIYPYKVTSFEGIKNKIGKEALIFSEGCDKVTFKSMSNNKYVSVSDDKKNLLKADKIKPEDAEIFAITNWGFSANTARSQKINKFVTTDNHSENQVEGQDGKQDENFLTASAEEVHGWFVREVFDFSEKDGVCQMKTWNNKYVTVDQNEVLKGEENDEQPAQGFTKNIVTNGLEEAVNAAKSSDAAIVFVGNNPYINGKEDLDRPDIILPPAQEKLIKEVYKANPNTIVVVIGSYPFAINWEEQNVPAILFSSHGGQEIGNAIADVLFGDYCPAGRLNMTWYKGVSQLTDIMDYDIIKGKRTYMYFDDEPLYPFGYGLSYTKFNYENMQISKSEINLNEKIDISVQIKNDGRFEGDEVVQLYISSEQSRVQRPIKQLKGFERVRLKIGESKNIKFTLDAKDFEFWDVTREKYCVEEGMYKIMIGASSKDIRLSQEIKINGEKIPKRNLMNLTKAENYDDYSGVYIDECEESLAVESAVRVKDVNNAWILFNDVDFEQLINSENKTFEARVFAYESECKVEIRLNSLNGELVGVCDLSCDGGDKSWKTCTCRLKEINNEQNSDLYLKLIGNMKISRFRFL